MTILEKCTSSAIMYFKKLTNDSYLKHLLFGDDLLLRYTEYETVTFHCCKHLALQYYKERLKDDNYLYYIPTRIAFTNSIMYDLKRIISDDLIENPSLVDRIIADVEEGSSDDTIEASSLYAIKVSNVHTC